MRLYGELEGREIYFDMVAPLRFAARLPSIARGSSVITLFAVDDAGNISTEVKALVLIDFSKMSIKVLNTNDNWLSQNKNNYFSSKPANGGESLWYSIRERLGVWESKFLIT